MNRLTNKMSSMTSVTTLQSFGVPPDNLSIGIQSLQFGVNVLFTTLNTTTIKFVADSTMLTDLDVNYLRAFTYIPATGPSLSSLSPFLAYVENTYPVNDSVKAYAITIQDLATNQGTSVYGVYTNTRNIHAVLISSYVYLPITEIPEYIATVQLPSIFDFVTASLPVLINKLSGNNKDLATWLKGQSDIYVTPFLNKSSASRTITGISVPSTVFYIPGSSPVGWWILCILVLIVILIIVFGSFRYY